MSTHHAPASSHRWRLGVALAITLTILGAEILGAWWTGSLALIVDAGHMAMDATGLIMAFVAASLALRPATPTLTWGFRRAEVISSGLQALFLSAVGIYAIVEAITRLITPPEVKPAGLLLFGVIGLSGNLASLWILGGHGHHDQHGHHGHEHDHQHTNLNMRAATLEVLNDALGSVAVIISAVILATTGFTRADSIASLVIATLILPRAWIILREAGRILLEAAPVQLDLGAVREHILAHPQVCDVHDLHASQISSELPVLTAHVIVHDEAFTDGSLPRLLAQLQECVATHFDVSVQHSTFQLEPAGQQLPRHCSVHDH